MFDAFSIAVKLSLVGGLANGLASIANQFVGLNRHLGTSQEGLTALEHRLKSIGKLTLFGGGLMAGGIAMAGALKGPYEEAKKLAQAKADFETLNLSAPDNASVYAKAATMSHAILGTTITENVKSIHDLHTAFGDLHHAMSAADDFARFSFVARVMNGGKPVEGLVYNAGKALEHRGGKVMNSDREFKTELDLMERVYLGSRGKVNPSEFFHASQTGKLAYTMMDKEELYGPFAAYMQAKTGSTAGTAAMTFNSSLIGGHMTKKAKGFMADLDLWDEGVSQKRLKMLMELRKGMTPEQQKEMGLLTPTHGGLKDEYVDMAVHRQSEFVQTVLAPAIRKRFGLDMSDEDVAVKLMGAFNRNTSDFMGEYVVNALKFKKDAAIFNQSKGIGDAYQHYLKTPEGAEEAASAAWKTFMTVLGSVYLPTITKGLLSLADSLDKLGQFADRHQTLVKVLVGGFIGLAGAMVFSGTIMLLTGGLKAVRLALGLVVGPMELLAGGKGLLPLVARGFLGVGSAIGGISFTGLIAGAGELAAGLGILALQFIGKGSLVAAAGLAGYAVGSMIAKLMEGTDVFDSIGRTIARILAFLGNENAKAALRARGEKVDDKSSTPQPKSDLERFHAGLGNQSSRYYGLNSTAGAGRGVVHPMDSAPAVAAARAVAEPVKPVAAIAVKAAEHVATPEHKKSVLQAADAAAKATAPREHHAKAEARGGQGRGQHEGPSVYVQLPQFQPIQIDAKFHLDGRQISEQVVKVMARDMGKPLAGPTGFDGSLFLASPAKR